MSARLLVADVLATLGVAIVTLAVYGVLRLPDTFTRIHAASKAAALGVTTLLLASFSGAQLDLIVRALVVMLFLSITAPVSSHALGRLEQASRAAKPHG